MKQKTSIAACVFTATVILFLSGCTGAPGNSSKDAAESAVQGEQAAAGPGGVDGSAGSENESAVMPASVQPDAALNVAQDEAGSGDAGPKGGDGAGAGEDDVNQSIDTLLGDHAAYRDVFDRLQRGVAAADKAGVAALVSYPLEVRVDGKSRRIRNPQEFIASWDGIFTRDLIRVISSQKFGNVFVNWQGVMLGDGQVWINGICRDKDCSTSDVRVVTIQPAAQ